MLSVESFLEVVVAVDTLVEAPLELESFLALEPASSTFAVVEPSYGCYSSPSY